MTKVLVADDSAAIRRLVADQLKADGFEVGEAADGEEAVKVAVAEAPDLLVLDKVMPGLAEGPLVRVSSARTRRASFGSCWSGTARRRGTERGARRC